ncbi:MAG: TetR/AcrR family transcriptional regulator [Parvibaculum sp.]
MPTGKPARTPGRKKAKPSAVQTPAAPPSRGERRKRETREKLLGAAFRLMAERGADAVTINEITEAADVGFGSFYNHFASREEIYGALIDSIFEDFADMLDRLAADIGDPAEVIAVSIRHTLRRARREPLWGRFLVREGLSPQLYSHGLGARLFRDIERGIAEERFPLRDPAMSFFAVGGGVLAAIAAELADDEAGLLKGHGRERKDLPERAAVALLQVLGIPARQAEAIARRPLPVADRQEI